MYLTKDLFQAIKNVKTVANFHQICTFQFFQAKIYNKECLKYKIIFSKDCYNFGMGPAINPVFGAWRASTVQKAFPLHVANLSLVPITTYGSLNTTNSKPRAQGQK